MVEPPACSSPFSTSTIAGGMHYTWRGRGSRQRATTAWAYNPYTEQWALRPTTGPTPPGLYYGACTAVGNDLYTFGGVDRSSRFNDLHKLSLDNFQWTKVEPRNQPLQLPTPKSGCGLVSVDDRTLCCFGGYGIGSMLPGSTFTRNSSYTDGCGWTNEMHFFNIQEATWSTPDVKGHRPPPCSGFSFTKVDQYRAVLFGGRQPDHGKVSDLYVFNFKDMVVTKVKQVQGGLWPVGRACHAACCLNYGDDHPTLLLSGGVDNDGKVLGDMWTLDVDTGTWTEVACPQSVKPRYYHSATATKLGPGVTEVLVFGGRLQWSNTTPVAETTIILRFESIAGPTTGKWALVDVAHNNTRGSRQRLTDKVARVRQKSPSTSSVCGSSVLSFSTSSQDEVFATDSGAPKAKERKQVTISPLEEVNSQCENEEIEEGTLREALHHTQKLLQEAEQRAIDAEQKEQSTQSELEGKIKELGDHEAELWKIPSNAVSLTRPRGLGGGRTQEGTLKVALKSLNIPVTNRRDLERLQKDTRVLAEVQHPNLIQFIGVVFDNSPPLVITELLDMDLQQAYEQSLLQPGNRMSIFIDIAQALDYLHQRYEPIIHRDVSTPNILLQKTPYNQWKGKLSDLSSAKFLQNAQMMGEGALVYSPPEVIPQPFALDTDPPPQTVKIDVYSFGIVLCEVTASRFPSQENLRDMFGKVKRDRPFIHKLILCCTKRDPNERPSMNEVLKDLGKIRPY